MGYLIVGLLVTSFAALIYVAAHLGREISEPTKAENRASDPRWKRFHRPAEKLSTPPIRLTSSDVARAYKSGAVDPKLQAKVIRLSQRRAKKPE